MRKLRFFRDSPWVFRTRVAVVGAFCLSGVLLYSSVVSLAWVAPVQHGLLEVVGTVASWIHHGIEPLKTWGESWIDRGGENNRLQRENARLTAEVAKLENLAKENESLRQLLNFSHAVQGGTFVTAAVLTSPLKGWNRTFLIGAGTAQGVRKGQPVVCPYGVVGRVAQVATHVARVMPLTHRECRIPVRGLTSRIEAILSGDGSAFPVLTYLQENQPLSVSEIMVTSPYDGVFPSGYRVGRLEKNDRAGVRVVPFAPWSRLEFVQIITAFQAPAPGPGPDPLPFAVEGE